MNEVFSRTILSASGALQYPWEITYGPDNNLWVTEARGYKVYKINPNTGVKTTVLNLATGSTFMGTWSGGPGGWPQGGFAGMAVHPKFLDPVTPKNYVYVAYVHRYLYGTSPSGIFYRNKLVRFTYNTGTGLLESPAVLCDTLPGSKDHNSQRMIIAPVTPGGTNYLFYASGDMGSGQFENRTRVMNAQNPASYEGKILRFNLDTVGGLTWIPASNPYSSTSAVWSIGIRNNQGFAYDTATNILYGSSHGAYSDDEINIIEQHRNFGHPLVIGYAEGNYNGNPIQGTNTSISAGAPWTTSSGISTCPPVGSEATRVGEINASGNGSYKGPLFSAYATPAATITTTWQTNPGNANWLSEAWSGLDLYSNKLIPGWKRSLVASGLKWGRLIRLKLGSTGTTTLPSNLDSANTADTITYFQSTNRYRDLAFAPNGKDIFLIMDNSSATSGPGVGNPTVPACPGCVVKYSFLGYASIGGLSAIPKSIDVTDGPVNTCNTGTTITIDASNNYLWVPITGPDGNIMAEINAMGQNLGVVTSSFYKHSGAIRLKNTSPYLDRNITISPAVTSFGTPVKLRLYISKAEYDLLNAASTNITSISDVRVFKNSDPCSATLNSAGILLNPTNSGVDLVHGTNGYVLQVNVDGFSSFYFGEPNMVLPLDLLTFTGSLQNDNTTLLKWKTENEINTSHFVVERSIDAVNYYPLGNVTASGITNMVNNYSFLDNDAPNQQSLVLFYRLKITDRDGRFKYSNIVTISLADIVGNVTAAPNPIKNEVRISIVAASKGNVEWKLVDNNGRMIHQGAAEVKKGAGNTILVNMSRLATGVYYFKVTGEGINQNIKLQKL